jgi:uncharacterized protein (TIGR00661 family)
MRFIFIIQGEGRGHQMQAAALSEILEENGHEIIRIFKGRSLFRKENTVSRGVKKGFYFSPFFISTKNRRGINLGITFIVNTILIPLYLAESIRLAVIIRNLKPDAVVNFYDIIGGLSFMLISSSVQKYVISHHFFFEHPDFSMPKNRKYERQLMLLHSWITSVAADKKLALSFNYAENYPEKKLYVIPPLLRKEIKQLQPVNSGHIHIYTLNPGYKDEIERWCKHHPEVHVNMFSDFGNCYYTAQQNLSLYSFNEESFIESLKTCSQVICTAGFETLAEAAFHNKPLEVVPTWNHFEQYCNALDLVRSGLGIMKSHFSPVINSSEENIPENRIFKNWVMEADKHILSNLCP